MVLSTVELRGLFKLSLLQVQSGGTVRLGCNCSVISILCGRVAAVRAIRTKEKRQRMKSHKVHVLILGARRPMMEARSPKHELVAADQI